jgi:hypothetical protein
MKLKSWIRTDMRSRAEMAAFIGVHVVTFGRWCAGKGTPTKRHIQKIHEMTGGKVSLRDFYKPEGKK